LEVLPTGGSHPFNPSPSYVSDDGSEVYGLAYKKFTQPVLDLYTLGFIDYPYFVLTEGNQEAKFRWDSSAGFEVLPSWLPDANEPFGDDRTIRGISADGSAVAGVIGRAPVIWSAVAGVQQPANLPTEYGSTNVDVVSADGTTVVGTYYATNCRYHPSACTPGAIGVSAPILFRWVVGGEIELLPETEGNYFDAYQVSGDGKTVLGFIATPQGNQGYHFIWRAGHGLENITDYFAARGMVVPYAGYHSAVEMSRDGLVFTGETTNPGTDANGAPTYHSTRWIVDLRAAPEAGSLIQLTAAALCLTFVGTRRRT
jgi:hypothetical protein